MLSRLRRPHALILAIAVLLALWWAQGTRRVIAPPPPASVHYSDVQLYRDVAARVARGEGYYPAITALHRAHHFPTRPFFTVRLPTLAELTALLGQRGVLIAAAALLFAACLAIVARFAEFAGLPAQIGAALGVLAGGAILTGNGLAAQHEVWAGILLTIAFALRGGRHWHWALAAGGAALAIRELSLPFLALAALFALAERRRGEATGWLALIALFAAALPFHAAAVHAHQLPGDLASPGWRALRGPGAAVRDLVECSVLGMLPVRLAGSLTLLPALGWLAAPRRTGLFALLLGGGYFALLALFARDQTFYWAIMLLPWWFAGYALVPRACAQLARAIGRRDPPAAAGLPG